MSLAPPIALRSRDAHGARAGHVTPHRPALGRGKMIPRLEGLEMRYRAITEAQDWRSALARFERHDFGHTFDFSHISSLNGEGDPILFCIASDAGEPLLLWPMLRRVIPGTPLYDLGSVYGYSGPLVAAELERGECLAAGELLFSALKDEGYVSMFSRMHPLFSDQLPQELRGHALGEIVVIDVRPGVDDVLMEYRQSLRYDIRKSRKRGVHVVIDESCADLDVFVAIYQRAMRDMGASDFYLFNRDYFRNIAEARDFKAFLSFAIYEGKAIGAGMSIVTSDIMQSYLGGSTIEYRTLSTDKLITAREHEIAAGLGVTEYVLGGGFALKNDTLLNFKKGFSRKTRSFSVFRKVLDRQGYDRLCRDQGVASDQGSFFPAYRGSGPNRATA